MYVLPSITLAKLVGAGLRLYFIQNRGGSEVSLMAAATGCILSEGTLGLLPLAMEALGVPRLF